MYMYVGFTRCYQEHNNEEGRLSSLYNVMHMADCSIAFYYNIVM